MRNGPPAWAAVLFCLWWALLAVAVGAVTLGQGELPVDYRTYAAAAERAEATGSPYERAAEAREIWARMHAAALAAFGLGEGPPAVVSGPYLYPPTLALRLPQGAETAVGFLALSAAAAAGMAIGWLRAAGRRSAWWLALAALAPAGPAVLAGGNVELIAMALALAACGLTWSGRGALAGVPAAAALLLKPHFLLLFLGFAVLSGRWRGASAAALVAAALMAAEAASWPEAARADALAYLADPLARQYLALPPGERWPMDLWNRAPMQALVWFGLPPAAAGWSALGLWAGLLALGREALRGRRPGFAPVFATAWVLFLIARPVSWALPFLELIVLAAAWPALGREARRALAVLAAGLSVARWAAYVGFLEGLWPGLLSLQARGLPWETALLIPGALILTLHAGRRLGGGARSRGGGESVDASAPLRR